MKRLLFLFFCLPLFLNAAQLEPGFNKQELLDMLRISAQQIDSAIHLSTIAPPEGYTLVYRSPVCGLDHRWDLWKSDANTAVICIRGTTERGESWLANFYAGMLPAEGKLKLSDSTDFQYKLGFDERASLHAGWLTALGFLWQSMSPKIDSLLSTGTRDILITGHSQGGAIATLLTSMLHTMKGDGRLPGDLRLKTWCSAAPKVGNLYFAYDYEYLTQWGLAFNVVNRADWVPQTPVTVQAVDDFVYVNPFTQVDELSKDQPLFVRFVARKVFKRMNKPVDKAAKRLRQNLGEVAGKLVEDELPGYAVGEYRNSMHYSRCGRTILLQTSPEYFEKFPDDKEKLFVHHFLEPYVWLVQKTT